MSGSPAAAGLALCSRWRSALPVASRPVDRYDSGDVARGRRSLESALRLAEPEQLRLPFTIERGWIRPVLQRDPALAHAHRCLLEHTLRHDRFPARLIVPQRVTVGEVEPLTERELEVLRHVSGMLSSAEVACEMYISINTVKTHPETSTENWRRPTVATQSAEPDSSS
jgi:DNA-binding CsgD family transcriptional regulator